MTREELIQEASDRFANNNFALMRTVSIFNILQYGFRGGIQWANTHKDLEWKPISGEPTLQHKPFILHSKSISPLGNPIKHFELYIKNKFNGFYQYDNTSPHMYSWEEIKKTVSENTKWIYIEDLLP